MIAQFLVLGILNVSLSTSQPQYRLKEPSQIRYIKYELAFLPSSPRSKVSPKLTSGIGYCGVEEHSNLASKAHEQQGIERYPEALYSVDSTGTHIVLLTARLGADELMSQAIFEQLRSFIS